MATIDLISSSSEDEEAPNGLGADAEVPAPVVTEPTFDVFPTISSEEIQSISSAIGAVATQEALNQVRRNTPVLQDAERVAVAAVSKYMLETRMLTPRGKGSDAYSTPRPVKQKKVRMSDM